MGTLKRFLIKLIVTKYIFIYDVKEINFPQKAQLLKGMQAP